MPEFIELESADYSQIDEWTCEARWQWRVTPSGDRPVERCGEPVGWGLREVQDTYDSGYERPEWTEAFHLGDGKRLLCVDCVNSVEDPSLNPQFDVTGYDRLSEYLTTRTRTGRVTKLNGES